MTDNSIVFRCHNCGETVVGRRQWNYHLTQSQCSYNPAGPGFKRQILGEIGMLAESQAVILAEIKEMTNAVKALVEKLSAATAPTTEAGPAEAALAAQIGGTAK